MIRLLFKLFTFVFGLVLIGTVCVNLFVYVSSEPYIYDKAEQTPAAEAALVPGAAILSDGNLSPIFLDRVDMAVTLYEVGKVSKILVSGDNSTDTYNEVNPAREYLIHKGVPDEDIFLDHAGFDTYSSMYRARDIFEVSSVIIVTQKFHLPRAVFLARTLGLNALGVKADVGSVLFRNHVREVLATNKAILDLLAQRLPKYLGQRIPIDEGAQNKM